MRIHVLLLALACVHACGDPVRKGDGYSGEPYVSYAARLTGPPRDFREGDSLRTGWDALVNGRWTTMREALFQPRSFPHDFTISLSTPPRSDLPIFRADGGIDLSQVWYVQVSLRSPHFPGPPARAASVNHWLAYSEGPVRLHPLGDDGPALDLPGGYRLIRRTCSPGQLNQLVVVPDDEVIVVEPLKHHTVENEYRARCGAPLLP